MQADEQCPTDRRDPSPPGGGFAIPVGVMSRTVFDHFSMRLPPGWQELSEDGTFSDPLEGERKAFGRPGGPSLMYVSLLPVDPERPPVISRDDALALARAWGRARGLAGPLSDAAEVREDGILAAAEYRLAGDYITVYYLSNGEATLHASFITSWKTRHEERTARDEMISSLVLG